MKYGNVGGRGGGRRGQEHGIPSRQECHNYDSGQLAATFAMTDGMTCEPNRAMFLINIFYTTITTEKCSHESV